MFEKLCVLKFLYYFLDVDFEKIIVDNIVKFIVEYINIIFILCVY